MKQHSWETDLAAPLRQFRKELKRLEHHIETTQSELEKAERWEEASHEALLLQSNLYQYKKGMVELTVTDWKTNQPKSLLLEPRVPIEDQLKRLFKTVKKLQKAIPHLQLRLEKLEKQRDIVQGKIAPLEAIKTEEEWDAIKHHYPVLKSHTPSPKKVAPKLPYKKFVSADGTEIWVGRTARDNETLSLKLARGNDWWLHTADVPGSHVVIRSDTPNHETLQDAMQLALHHSKLAKSGEAEIILTQSKYVSRGPGGHKPGTVSVSKHKKCKVIADSALILRLKQTILLP